MTVIELTSKHLVQGMTLIHLLSENIDLGLKTKNFRLKDFSFSDLLNSVNGYQRFATKLN